MTKLEELEIELIRVQIEREKQGMELGREELRRRCELLDKQAESLDKQIQSLNALNIYQEKNLDDTLKLHKMIEVQHTCEREHWARMEEIAKSK